MSDAMWLQIKCVECIELNTFFLLKYILEFMHVTGRKKEGNVLFNDAFNTFYGYVAIVREETHCRHYMGYSFQLAAGDLLYALSHRHAFGILVMEHWLK